MKDFLDCGLCETSWVLGEKGTCNRTSNVCECSEGFSGNDDWLSTQTCHVNDQLARIFHIFIFVIGVIGFIWGCTATATIFRRWRKSANLVGDRFLSKKFFCFCFLPNPQDSNSMPTFEANLHRNSVIYGLCVTAFSFSFVLYQSPYAYRAFMKEDALSLEDDLYIHNLILSLSVSQYIGSGCFLLTVWYRTLAPMKTTGPQLNVHGFIMRYPNSIFHVAGAGLFFGIFYPLTIIVIIPHFFPESFKNLLYAFVGGVLLINLLLGAFKLFVINQVQHQFKDFRNISKRKLSSDSLGSHLIREPIQKNLIRCEEGLRVTSFYSTVVIATLLDDLAVHVPLLALELQYQYMFSGLYQLGTITSSVILLHLVAYRSDGGLRPLITSRYLDKKVSEHNRKRLRSETSKTLGSRSRTLSLEQIGSVTPKTVPRRKGSIMNTDAWPKLSLAASKRKDTFPEDSPESMI